MYLAGQVRYLPFKNSPEEKYFSKRNPPVIEFSKCPGVQQNVHRVSYQIVNLNFIQENYMSEINSYGKYNSCRCLEIPTGF